LERKLTAILCADVFGYSRLMGEDEEATLRTLSSHRKLIDSLIEQHHGRFVNSAGDSVLAEFASVVNAVHAPSDPDHAQYGNANIPPERRMEFRSINLGDVMVDGEQIFGDGVNVDGARTPTLFSTQDSSKTAVRTGEKRVTGFRCWTRAWSIASNATARSPKVAPDSLRGTAGWEPGSLG
jgi:class 3 adenylate cyclase